MSLTCQASACNGPYFYYFNLPNDERYYDFTQGPVHIFVLDSYKMELSGVISTSVQADWLHTQLAASTAPWNIVIVPHAPYSSGAVHGSTADLQWPYKEWGADAVISGNDHIYERLLIDDLPYFVNGLGGTTQGAFLDQPVEGSITRYADAFGALHIEADDQTLTFQFINVENTVIDSYTLTATSTPLPTTMPEIPEPTPTDTPEVASPTPTDTPDASLPTASPTDMRRSRLARQPTPRYPPRHRRSQPLCPLYPVYAMLITKGSGIGFHFYPISPLSAPA
jgi:hypothetical protein